MLKVGAQAPGFFAPMLLPIVHRVTYVVDPRGIIAGVFDHELQVVKHLDQVLHFVRHLAAETTGHRREGRRDP